MTDQHRRVTPTDPPSMAVLVDGNALALKNADHFQNRTDVVYRRFYLEEPSIEDGFPQFRKGLRVISYPDPRSSIEQDGWEVIATVRVMVGQSVVVHGNITQLVGDESALLVSSQPEPKVHLVLYDSGQICTALVDNPGLAEKRAQAVSGVVVELPILSDYRKKDGL